MVRTVNWHLHLLSKLLLRDACGVISSEFVARSVHQLTGKSLVMWEEFNENVQLATRRLVSNFGDCSAIMPFLFGEQTTAQVAE